MATILLDGERLTLADLERVALHGEAVANRRSRTTTPHMALLSRSLIFQLVLL